MRKVANYRHKQSGLSIIELMITLTIAGILIAIAAPAFRESIAKNAIISEANRLASSLRFARSQAVNKQQVVTLATKSGTATDWTAGWRIFTDNDSTGNQAYDAANDVLLKDIEGVDKQTDVKAKTSKTDLGENTTVSEAFFSFDPRGLSMHRPNKVEISICDVKSASNIEGRKIIINVVGRVAIEPLNCT